MKAVWWSQWRSRWAVFAHDFLSIPIAWFGAYWLRFNLGKIPDEILSEALFTLPWVMLFQMGAFWVFGLYRGVWRYASLPDLSRIVKAIVMGSLMTLLAVFLITRLQNLPRSVMPLYSMTLLFILGGSRFVYRRFKDKRFVARECKRVLVVGAGLAGESLVRDLLRDIHNSYIPVAFVDDNLQKRGRELHGIRVVGTCDHIPQVVKQYAVDMILVAVPSAKASEMRRIVSICEATQIPLRTLPSTNDLVSGLVLVKNLREISLEDLLGRDPVTLDWSAIDRALTGKVVLVSGGGGSIGAQLCRQILKLAPKQLIIFDNSEYNLFCVQQALAEEFADKVPLCHLVDLNDTPAINHLLQQYKIQIIFHAAAYKHVPLLEGQIRIAAKNNIIGTYHLAQSAIDHGVEKFVLVSSDKAVNPTNVMGATKRVAELVCQYFNSQDKTRFITVRFGNVLGSRGSVVETFQKQLEKGGPITVTHPDITRYFMTIQEASVLILQSLAIGEGGELFVLDMGEPIKISYLAEQMIRLVDNKEKDINIEYIGLRPGEKLFEELFHSNERLAKTSHAKIMIGHARVVEKNKFEQSIFELQKAIWECHEDKIFVIIKELVPEFQTKQTYAENELEVAC
ncbi:MAG: polysaccharide biosynthesis protein [Proteobacteria bacterium]|nr:polysaccharide biosynthesis protein [Pseudomonadota bacterium]